MSDKRYHLSELQIALDRSTAAHWTPPIRPEHKAILDVGCGMGQTLIAARLADDVQAYGVDYDAELVEEAKKLCGPNVHLSVARGEDLGQFPVQFDLVYCRVAIPYMDINAALGEMARVLKPGGEVWLLLHPLAMYRRRAWASLKAGRLKDALFCGYIALNGFCLTLLGRQFRLGPHMESFQGPVGIRRALERAGFEKVEVVRGKLDMALARKKGYPQS